jgi:hypothetical protein
MARKSSVSDVISRRFKGTNPFASMKLTPQIKLWARDNLHPNDMQNFINEFGQDRVGYMLYQMNELKMKQGLK